MAAKPYNKPIVVIGSSKIVDNGPIYEGKYRVRYFDADGTILKIEYVAEGEKTTPPAAPSYDPDYLIFAEWNYDTDNYIVEQPTDIGAIYDTVDDATYIFCRLTTKTGLDFVIAVNNATSIDWGDGTVDTSTSHIYANEGNYIIKIYGEISLSTHSSSGRLLSTDDLLQSLTKVYVSNKCTSLGYSFLSYSYSVQLVSIPSTLHQIGGGFTSSRGLKHVNYPRLTTSISSHKENYSLSSISINNKVSSLNGEQFSSCMSLKNIVIPNSVTSLGSNTFTRCYSLEYLVLPKNISSLPSGTFYYCYNLKDINIPDSVTSFSENSFASCSSLQKIIIPEGVTAIMYNTFNSCFNLKYVSIPSTVTSIASSAFSGTYTLRDVIVNCTTVPTLSSTNVFTTNAGTIFWVNDSIIEQLKVATNWSTYADYMKPLSWYPSLTDPNA